MTGQSEGNYRKEWSRSIYLEKKIRQKLEELF